MGDAKGSKYLSGLPNTVSLQRRSAASDNWAESLNSSQDESFFRLLDFFCFSTCGSSGWPSLARGKAEACSAACRSGSTQSTMGLFRAAAAIREGSGCGRRAPHSVKDKVAAKPPPKSWPQTPRRWDLVVGTRCEWVRSI